jgi:hypothetical protein
VELEVIVEWFLESLVFIYDCSDSFKAVAPGHLADERSSTTKHDAYASTVSGLSTSAYFCSNKIDPARYVQWGVKNV